MKYSWLRIGLLTTIAFALGIGTGMALLDQLYPLPGEPEAYAWQKGDPYPQGDQLSDLEFHLMRMVSNNRFDHDLTRGDLLQCQSTLAAPTPAPPRAPDLDDPLEEMAIALLAMEKSLELLERDLGSTPGEYNQLIISAISWLNEAHFQIADARMGVFYADAINDRAIPPTVVPSLDA